jgi:pyrimidine-specific ribonucleoside hydrolase
MKRYLSVLFGLLITFSLESHPWKPEHYVIIDTDGGIDDIRAVSMLLASPDVRVLAVTISPGALDADNAYKKIRSLLNSYYHDGVLVGINRNCNFRSPVYPVALKAKWGEESGINPQNAPDCISLIREILSLEKTPVSFICLGGLTTASMAIREIPDFRKQVKEIVWSSSGLNDSKGFNYSIDKEAASFVPGSAVPVKAIDGFVGEKFYDEKTIKSISEIPTVYAARISSFFDSESAKNHEYSFAGNDDMVPLYLHWPDIFTSEAKGKNSECRAGSNPLLREKALKIFAGETVARNQVINALPADPSFYFSDIAPSVTEIIQKHGMDEWVSGVIANELHRHLGTFAIIGVKMGIRVREYFSTGVDEFIAVSYAGSVPPVSCMNDGIQVSTGSTPGHGLLTVKNEKQPVPSVEFTYMNRKIRLTLKPEYADKIISELKEINFIYGLDSNIYWELVRKNTIKYWLSLDRHNIFNIEVLN